MTSPPVVSNRYGYFELAEKPTAESLREYYERKYYQQSQATYAKEYEDREIRYFLNKLEQKHVAASGLLKAPAAHGRRFLDVGAGEGWALRYFSEKEWDCLGLDYSDFGCRQHNPEQLPRLRTGDMQASVAALAADSRQFDLVLLDNVLEHVLDPLALLRELRGLVADGGVLIVEVPNDFSILQTRLLEAGDIPEPFWVVAPDHISYFNRTGLEALARDAGWKTAAVMGGFPIDINLLNPDTNYIRNRALGKRCHFARVEFENLLHDISPQLTNELYRVMADMGLGRELIAFFNLD
ncbi:MAG: class I SAM-dependent methyltransferase [Ignavibacteria bacterium]